MRSGLTTLHYMILKKEANAGDTRNTLPRTSGTPRRKKYRPQSHQRTLVIKWLLSDPGQLLRLINTGQAILDL